MDNFEYTVTTNEPFGDVMEAVEKKSLEEVEKAVLRIVEAAR